MGAVRKEFEMPIPDILVAHRAEILRIATKYGAQKVRIFGSMARGDSQPNSDVDFLVELDEQRSLMDLGGMLSELEALLGRKVDLVEPDGLHRLIRDRVLAEAVAL